MTTTPTMPERIGFFASRVATTLFEAGHIDQRNHAKVSKVVALMVNDELNQSLLAQSVLREALNQCREMMRNLHGWYPKPDELWKTLEPVQGTVARTLSTTTPPTDRIVVTREMVEAMECYCGYQAGDGKKGFEILKCHRCQLLAQFPSEQTTKEKGE